MAQIYSKALNKQITIERLIAKVEGETKGPTMVFFGGIHGNESAGVFALQDVLKNINPSEIKGSIYAVSGNLKALEKGLRYIDKDLNRIWTEEDLQELDKREILTAEDEEQHEVYAILKEILNTKEAPYYFIDLHTTSSKTLPFITINDALINRKFSQCFPVPIVLGIEEYLNGPLLSYINKMGYVSLGFESGQHDDKAAVDNAIAFINLALIYAGISNEPLIKSNHHYNLLRKNALEIDDVFEVIHLHRISNGSKFIMKPNFKSFQDINKGTPLATHNGTLVVSPDTAQLFMPLYQEKGLEGFFLIKRIKPFFLKLSAHLRNIKADGALVVLPGISWLNKEEGVLKVNLKVAKYLAKELFHLFGYRNKVLDKTHLILYNRERVAKKEAYKNTDWFNR